ncbi:MULTISPECIES: hypothetical protein [Nostocaceae]|uniref:hypothetical protein n=1 Tax=Nostocaceae TaxID=1162 RepID=UPI0037BFA5E1
MVYKFEQLTRTEVEPMLGITLKETRVYREIKEEGLEEGREQGREEGREQATVNLILRLLSNHAKLITVIASEAKQSQPLRLLHFASLHSQ